ncbi:hypothetical protein BH23PLA1_BH23PLA1_29280 [soil metagenome]
MISEARQRANRLNAQKSTGPQTETGKQRARGNALKHGLAGSGVVLPTEEAEAVDRRLEEWSNSLPAPGAAGPDGDWLARQFVLASLRIDRCQEQERARRIFEASQAMACWEENRSVEAEKLGAQLSRHPALIALQLRNNRQGCNWLLLRWRQLGNDLAEECPWEATQQNLLLDLLGSPMEFREADIQALLTTPNEEIQEIIQAEIEALETLKAESLDDLDDTARAMAEAGLPAEESAELRRLRRYEATAWHQFRQSHARLRAGGLAPSDRPQAPLLAPATEPEPEPRHGQANAEAPAAIEVEPEPEREPIAATEPRPVLSEAFRQNGHSTASPWLSSSSPQQLPAPNGHRLSSALPAPLPSNRQARRAGKKRARS